jgi:predicted ATPase
MIEQLSLRNILTFQSLDLPFGALTLLAGTNSAGKSSVLHSLALLRQSSFAKTLPESLLLNGELVELGTGRDLLHSDPISLPKSSEWASRISISADGRLDTWTAAYEAAADTLRLEDADESTLSSPLFTSGFQYLRADRIVPAVTYPKSHEEVVVRRFLGSEGQHAANFLRVHGGEPLRCLQAEIQVPSGRSLDDQVNAWLDRLSPGTSVEVLDVEATGYVRLVFRRSGPQVKTEPHRATNVGFGLTYALPVIIACLSSSPGDVLLIENPEAHLHPAGQALLGRLCALASAGGAQVIIETHSDHVLNAIRLAVKTGELQSDDVRLHFFSRQENVLQPRVDSLRIGSDGMLPAWPEGFFDQWDRALTQLLS